jgi:RHS repeat-associated protein
MQSQNETLLWRYGYDPLDRLGTCTPLEQSSTQRFYLRDRLATEVQSALQCSIFQNEDHVLAQCMRHSGVVGTTLLATDFQRSVLNTLEAGRHSNSLVYSPYGHRPVEGGLLSLLGFNGERPDPVTGHYLLGNGYRAFNPVLMRFNSPDNLSPFGKGGLNTYAYCLGDPVNYEDRSGHTPKFIKSFLRGIGLMSKPKPATKVVQQNTIDQHAMVTNAITDRPSSNPVEVAPAAGLGLTKNEPPFQSASNNSFPKKPVTQIRVTNEQKKTVGMFDIDDAQRNSVDLTMKFYKGTAVSLQVQSDLIRQITKLPTPKPGEYYRFPNSIETLTRWPDGSLG